MCGSKVKKPQIYTYLISDETRGTGSTNDCIILMTCAEKTLSPLCIFRKQHLLYLFVCKNSSLPQSKGIHGSLLMSPLLTNVPVRNQSPLIT